MPQAEKPSTRGLIGDLLGLTGDLLDNILDTISAVSATVLNALSTAASNLNNIATSLRQRLQSHLDELLDLPSSILESAVDILKAAVQVPATVLTSITNALSDSNPNDGRDIIIAQFNNLWGAINSAINQTALVDPAVANELRDNLVNFQNFTNAIIANVTAAANLASTGLNFLFRKKLSESLGDPTVQNMQRIIEFAAEVINNATSSFIDATTESPFITLLYDAITATVPAEATASLENAEEIIEEVVSNATNHANLQISIFASQLSIIASEFVTNTTDSLLTYRQKLIFESYGLSPEDYAELQNALHNLTEVLNGAYDDAINFVNNFNTNVVYGTNAVNLQANVTIDEILTMLQDVQELGVHAITNLTLLAKNVDSGIVNCAANAVGDTLAIINPYLVDFVSGTHMLLTLENVQKLETDVPKLVPIYNALIQCVNGQVALLQFEASNTLNNLNQLK